VPGQQQRTKHRQTKQKTTATITVQKVPTKTRPCEKEKEIKIGQATQESQDHLQLHPPNTQNLPHTPHELK